jgi:hypothetical protein
LLTLGITPGRQQQKASSAMPVTDLPPLRLYLELTADRVATLKVHHNLRSEPREYVRYFLECHASRELIFKAADAFARQRSGSAIRVEGGSLSPPLVTISFPLADRPIAAQLISLASDLLQAVESAANDA